jgi:small subunit ribosomal protein S20
MPRNKSILKAMRQNRKRRTRNQGVRTRYRTAVKKILASTEQENAQVSPETLVDAVRTIGKTASKGVIHKRTASRKISRLSRRVHRLQKQETPSS